MNAKILAIALILFLSLLLSGCIQQGISAQNPESKTKLLEASVKKQQERIERLETLVGVYKSLNDCKEKALVNFIDGNTIVQKTTLKDAFDRCEAVFSMLKALAEKEN